MKTLGYAALGVAAAASIVFVNALQPVGLEAALIIAAWLLIPYAILALALAFLARDRAWTVTWAVVAALVAAGGLLFLTEVVYLHPDAQGGIAVMFTPLYQGLGIGVLVPATRWLIGKSGQ